MGKQIAKKSEGGFGDEKSKKCQRKVHSLNSPLLFEGLPSTPPRGALPFVAFPFDAMRSLARCQPSVSAAGPSGHCQRAVAQQHQGKEKGEQANASKARSPFEGAPRMISARAALRALSSPSRPANAWIPSCEPRPWKDETGRGARCRKKARRIGQRKEDA